MLCQSCLCERILDHFCSFLIIDRECDGVHYPTQRRDIELGNVSSRRYVLEEDAEEEDHLLESEEQPLTSTLPT